MKIKTLQPMDIAKTILRIVGIIFFLFWNMSVFADDTTWNEMAERCKADGWSESQIEQMNQLLARAKSSGVPVDSVSGRIQEGMAKKAKPDLILQAAAQRTSILENAVKLTVHAGCPNANLTQSVGLALESGVPATVMERVLQEGRSYRTGQLRSVIEVGETLHLNGLPDEVVQSLMLDFLQRNLRRGEMFRAARVAEREYSDGMDVQHIRKGLWGGNGNALRNNPGASSVSSSGRGSGNMRNSSSRGGSGHGGNR